MKRTSLLALTLAASLVSLAGAGHAEDGIDKAKARNFDAKLFAQPFDEKTYACFVRRYDANHLAQHPRQNVSTMKLLVTAEVPPEDQSTVNYSFRVGFQYRNRRGHFDSSGSCGHVVAQDRGDEIRLGCGVDCDGGGIQVAMKDDKTAIVQVERIRVWDRKKPDDDAGDARLGADDKVFRVDRADLRDCAELVTDRKELAALRQK